MYVGLDHGTTSLRVGVIEGGSRETFSLPRERGVSSRFFEIVDRERVDLAAITYSMGDAITSIRDIRDLEDRGVRSGGGAGKQVGAGTELFDSIRDSGMETVVLPGLHRETPHLHRAFRAYSHCASGDKLAAAYRAVEGVGESELSLSDVGSNTVTVGVKGGELIGGIDAPIFSPGIEQGPLDVEAIRRIDSGRSTANEEFGRGGTGDREALTDLVAMEMAAMDTLIGGSHVLTGRLAPVIKRGVEDRLRSPVRVMDEYSSAVGCAEVARDVDGGAEEVLGFEVRL